MSLARLAPFSTACGNQAGNAAARRSDDKIRIEAWFLQVRDTMTAVFDYGPLDDPAKDIARAFVELRQPRMRRNQANRIVVSQNRNSLVVRF